jgi:hypothetical protein
MKGARFASGRELKISVVLRGKGYNLSRSKKPFPPHFGRFRIVFLIEPLWRQGQNIIDGRLYSAVWWRG